jgi:rhodanese-related sulfurtransferase
LSLKEARSAVKEGARWIDVREKKDGGGDLYPQALSVPISTLRDRLSELDVSQLNICICGNGRLSAAAAFILRQRGYRVAVLEGGLQSMRADRHERAVSGS